MTGRRDIPEIEITVGEVLTLIVDALDRGDLARADEFASVLLCRNDSEDARA